MSVVFPRCVLCRVTIEPGANVVFQPDGRVHHVECPTVVCAHCSGEIRPGAPIRRDDGALLHANCWMRRYRAAAASVARPAVDEGRRGLIADRVATGALPRMDPTHVTGAASRGSACSACTDAIPGGQIEYEVEFANTVILRFHRGCYGAWQDARVTPPISGSSVESPLIQIFHERIARRAAWDRSAFEDLCVAAAEARHAAAESRQRSRAARAACAQLLARREDVPATVA
jgi:hypothetical protein